MDIISRIMNNFILYIGVILIFVGNQALAQTPPQINNIEKTYTWPGDTITITGANFSANIADLQVWFGAVEGKITSATESIIDVIVPSGARFDAITVLNKTTRLRGHAGKRFFPAYSGEEAFDPSLFSSPLVFGATGTEKEFLDLVACDFNLDGKADIAATKNENSGIMILQNTSTPENLSFTRTSYTQVANPSYNISCGDLNGDGLPEMIFSKAGASNNNFVYIIPNLSTPGGAISFGAPISVVFGVSTDVARRIKVADLNFDGQPEIIVTNGARNTVYIFKNISTSAIQFETTPLVLELKTSTHTAASSNGLEVLDLNGDRVPDLVVTPFFDNNVYIFKNTSTGATLSFGSPSLLETTQVMNIKAGDLDHDGLPELIATGVFESKIFVFKNNSNSTINFATPLTYTAAKSPWGLDLADMNGDSHLDIVVANQNAPQIDVYVNQSTTGTIDLTRKSISTTYNSRHITSNDFDGDGKPDLAYTSYLTTGPYRIEVIRNKNCFVPIIRNEPGLLICPGQTKLLKAIPNPASTFTWSKDGVVQSGSDNILSITTEGTYTVEAVTEGGACTITQSYTVGNGTGTVPGDPSPTYNEPVCADSEIQLSIDPVTDAVYSWTGPDNFTSNEQNPVIPNATADNSGVYTVNIKVGDCLSSEKSTTVNVVTLPIFTVSSQYSASLCEGTSNTLTVTSRTGYSYQWLKDKTPIDGANATTFTATNSGAYAALVTDNTTGCSDTTTVVNLSYYSTPVIDFALSKTPVCTGEQLTITNNSTVDPNATVSYSWTFGNSTSSTDASPAVTYTTAGSYDITLNISYPGVTGCTATKTISVIVSDPVLPSITASVMESCPGELVDLSISGTYQQITWSTGESTAAISVDNPGTYTVSTLDNNGCAGEDQVTIVPKAVPDVVATVSRNQVQAGDTVQLNASGADQYTWEPASLLDFPNTANPIATVSVDTTFKVVGTLTGGCSDSATVKVLVEQGTTINVSPLKVFSPESTINPTWEIDLRFLSESCNLTIFDERGRRLFEKSDNFFEWDATYNGNPLPEGVYYYVIGCPNKENKAGTVLVVRK